MKRREEGRKGKGVREGRGAGFFSPGTFTGTHAPNDHLAAHNVRVALHFTPRMRENLRRHGGPEANPCPNRVRLSKDSGLPNALRESRVLPDLHPFKVGATCPPTNVATIKSLGIVSGRASFSKAPCQLSLLGLGCSVFAGAASRFCLAQHIQCCLRLDLRGARNRLRSLKGHAIY